MKGIALILILVLLGLLLFSNCHLKCHKFDGMENYANRFSGLNYVNACEYNDACRWDVGRTVQLSNGMEGVCTLNGLACPSFSKDHDRAQYAGMSPTMVDAYYDKKVHPWRYDDSGETALEMLV